MGPPLFALISDYVKFYTNRPPILVIRVQLSPCDLRRQSRREARLETLCGQSEMCQVKSAPSCWSRFSDSRPSTLLVDCFEFPRSYPLRGRYALQTRGIIFIPELGPSRLPLTFASDLVAAAMPRPRSLAHMPVLEFRHPVANLLHAEAELCRSRRRLETKAANLPRKRDRDMSKPGTCCLGASICIRGTRDWQDCVSNNLHHVDA